MTTKNKIEATLMALRDDAEGFEVLRWDCPVCGEENYDPNDYRVTMCHGGHVVQLGHPTEHGAQEAEFTGETIQVASKEERR